MRPVLRRSRVLAPVPKEARSLSTDVRLSGSAASTSGKGLDGGVRRQLREGHHAARAGPEHEIPPRLRAQPRAAGAASESEAAEPKVEAARPLRNRRRLAGFVIAAFAALAILLALTTHEGGSHHRSAVAPRVVGQIPSPAPISGVGMPLTVPGNSPIKPLRIALVLGRGLSPHRREVELQTFESWLSRHVNAATRLTILDPATHGRTASFFPADTPAVPEMHAFDGSPEAALNDAYHLGRGRRVLLTDAHIDLPPGRDLAILDLRFRRQVQVPAKVVLRPGERTTVAVDPQVRHAIAATAARAVISISAMLEVDQR